MKICLDEFGRLRTCEEGYVVFECPEDVDCKDVKMRINELKELIKKSKHILEEFLSLEGSVLCCALREVFG